MAFHPLQPGFSQSLLGTGDLAKFVDVGEREDTLYGKRIRTSERIGKNKNTVIIITISAIIFVTVVSIYDVIRNAINNYYATIALNDPNANNSQDDINSTIIGNRQGLIASFVFAIFCILVATILVYILLKLM